MVGAAAGRRGLAEGTRELRRLASRVLCPCGRDASGRAGAWGTGKVRALEPSLDRRIGRCSEHGRPAYHTDAYDGLAAAEVHAAATAARGLRRGGAARDRRTHGASARTSGSGD